MRYFVARQVNTTKVYFVYIEEGRRGIAAKEPKHKKEDFIDWINTSSKGASPYSAI